VAKEEEEHTLLNIATGMASKNGFASMRIDREVSQTRSTEIFFLGHANYEEFISSAGRN
jgi:hypothetical protein